MKLRFFLDHCVSSFVAAELERLGHEVFRLRDHLPQDSPDPIVIAKAQKLNAILISLNGDFADIVTYPPAIYQGVIALQVRNHPEVMPHMMQRLSAYLQHHSQQEYYSGKLFLVETHRIRVRE